MIDGDRDPEEQPRLRLTSSASGKTSRSSRDQVKPFSWMIAGILISVLASFLIVRYEVERGPQFALTPAQFAKQEWGGAGKSNHKTISLADLYRRSTPAIFRVDASQDVKGKVLPTEERTGTGFLIDTHGHLLTNYHVVEGTTDVNVIFRNDRIVRAHVLGTDPSNDLALLEAPATDGIRPLRLGDSAALVPGQPIAAIGNPLGLTDTLSSGIVSALDRTISAPNGYSIAHIIQGDIEINQGSSGGPLFDAYGDVVGITAAIARKGDGSVPGVAYAIPASTIRTVLARLLKGAPVQHAYLGVRTLTILPRYAAALGLQSRQGALVLLVQKGGPAARAGLRACTKTITIDGGSYRTGGDIIAAVNGEPVRSSDDLSALVGGLAPGRTVRLTVYRGRHRIVMLRVRLGQRPAS